MSDKTKEDELVLYDTIIKLSAEVKTLRAGYILYGMASTLYSVGLFYTMAEKDDKAAQSFTLAEEFRTKADTLTPQSLREAITKSLGFDGEVH